MTSYSGDSLAVPVYAPGQFDFPKLPRDSRTHYSDYDGSSEQRAWFAQDLISIDDWSILLGVRRSEYQQDQSSTYYPQFNSTRIVPAQSLDSTSYNAGLVYNLTANAALYASYSEGFLPQFPAVANCAGGNSFPPMETVNKEVGVKLNSSDNALSWTTAAFQLEQSNRLEYNGARACYQPRQAQQLKGFETELTGRLLPGLDVIASYTYTSSKDRGDPSNLPAAQPRHQANLWSNYAFQSVPLKGFGVSLGVSAYSGTRLGTSNDEQTLPGAARVDAGVFYSAPDWSARLGVKNLFDRELYGYSSSTIYVPILDGRTLTLTLNKSL
ncbi:TonB-dependent siderophore receptor [Phytopseudomonas flavescens]|nr:TonB-dependent receptor [Pseudomonas flavescens]